MQKCTRCKNPIQKPCPSEGQGEGLGIFRAKKFFGGGPRGGPPGRLPRETYPVVIRGPDRGLSPRKPLKYSYPVMEVLCPRGSPGGPPGRHPLMYGYPVMKNAGRGWVEGGDPAGGPRMAYPAMERGTLLTRG